MNGGSPQPWPESIESIIKLGEGNGYAQPWESMRKGPSLLAELAEQTGKDINALTPEERIAFRIGWVRGRIRKYEEAGTVDPAEIAHAKENEEFYRKKLQEVLERPTPSPESSPAPHPNPLPLLRQDSGGQAQGEGTAPPSPSPPKKEGEPPPEAAAETPGFSRYLKEILAGSERNNILKKLAGASGRLWIDKKNAQGKTVRIWLSLDLTPAERAKPEDELKDVIDKKLREAAKNPDRPLPFRFRVDDLSAGHSWKEKWAAKKAGISTLVDGVAAASDTERPAACAALASSLFGAEAASEPNSRKTFIAILQQYLTRPDGKSDVWTHVRNAYWHSEPWEADLEKVSRALGATFTIPTYKKARVKTWEKMEERASALLAPAGQYVVRIQGKDAAEYSLAERKEKDGKTSYNFAGLGWVREDDLRICEKKEKQPDGSWKPVDPAIFELMAWQVQAAPPKNPPVTPTTTAGGKECPDVKGPVVPPKPVLKESHESAEILRKQEVIAIPDIHGDADALFDSLKEAGYVKGSRAGEWELEPRANTERIILTGDLLDRGPQNLETLDLILECKKRGANLEVIAGNHDLFIPEALGEELSELHMPAAKISALAEWIGNDDDARVLQEVCKKYFSKDTSLPKMIDLCKRAHHAAYDALVNSDDAEFRRILTDPIFRKILQKAQEIFLSDKGPYKPIFDDLRIMTAADDILYVHAGINNRWLKIMLDAAQSETTLSGKRERAVQAANAQFQKLLKSKPSEISRTELRDIIWIRKFGRVLQQVKRGNHITEEGRHCTKVVEGLRQLGFRLIVHGHDRGFKAQEEQKIDDLSIVNGDVSMSAGYRGSRKAFLRVGKDGRVAAQNGAKKNPELTKLPTRKQ